MKVRVCDIRGAGAAGLPVDFQPGPQWYAAALQGMAADTSRGALGGEMLLTQVDESILVSGRVEARLSMACVRCLRETPVSQGLDMNMILLPRRAAQQDAPGQEAADDEEVSYYAGDDIDVGDLVREALLLALPAYPLCREECRGLCPRCGTDLNDGPCGCPAEVETPFGVLRGLKIEQG
ncbi:MAG TPA: DUF177 domain-containing protein [Myxococcota bacterium]|jgi:uncharacterized protein|nr:DUF177 domain-containing protein [Myxococcota bacterium]